MTGVQALRLAAGDPGPLQQSGVSCGPACLTVARMMISPGLTRWILYGLGPRGEHDSRPTSARFAEHEQQVLARTNSVMPSPGALQAPWPRALGMPPWGAQSELENGAALPGTCYAITLLRHLTSEALEDTVRRLLGRLDVGMPMLLYVGSPSLPRHVTLAFVGEQGQRPTLYDPGCGRVGAFPAAALVQRRLGLSGWDHPWIAVHPAGPAPVRNGADVFAAMRGRMTSPVADCSGLSNLGQGPGRGTRR
ncbi:MAG: hypothetical protein Q4P32_03870 [Micrococcales bacterium]|nr:hypothetical protein [Micrococcales bacterium]